MWTTKDAIEQIPGVSERAEVRRLRAKLRRLGEAYRRLRTAPKDAFDMVCAEAWGHLADLEGENARLRRHAEAMANELTCERCGFAAGYCHDSCRCACHGMWRVSLCDACRVAVAFRHDFPLAEAKEKP